MLLFLGRPRGTVSGKSLATDDNWSASGPTDAVRIRYDPWASGATSGAFFRAASCGTVFENSAASVHVETLTGQASACREGDNNLVATFGS